MFTKEEIKLFIIKLGNKYIFPDFTNKLTWYVVTVGVGIIVMPQPFKLLFINWCIEVFNLNSGIKFTLPEMDSGNDYLTGLILISIGFVHNIGKKYIELRISHNQLISLKEAHKDNNEILSMLSVLSNDLMKCAEKSAMYAFASKCGPPTEPLKMDNLELANYDIIKPGLIKLNVFSPKQWERLDYLKNEIKTVNNFIQTKSRGFALGKIYYFSLSCYESWEGVASIYEQYGGDKTLLTRPDKIIIEGIIKNND
jgi:hypothetical protein